MAEAVGIEKRVFTGPKRKGRLSELLKIARRKPLGTVAFLILLGLVTAAIFAPLVAAKDPNELRPLLRLQGPSGTFWLGTDQVGRDVFARIVYGSRISIYVGILAVLIGTGTGILIGLISGYFGGWVDLLIQRGVDTMMAFPGLVLALVFVTVLGPGLTNMMIAIGIIVAPGESRVVRSAVLSIKENTYMEAGKAVGVSTTRMLMRYVLPNISAPIIVIASILIANAILIEAALSFLGLGVQPPTASWGNMLSAEGRRYMELAPWLAIAPGAAIMVCVLSFNLFGDTLRDIMDPRLRGT